MQWCSVQPSLSLLVLYYVMDAASLTPSYLLYHKDALAQLKPFYTVYSITIYHFILKKIRRLNHRS